MYTHAQFLTSRDPYILGSGGEEINITIFTRHSMAKAIRKGKLEIRVSNKAIISSLSKKENIPRGRLFLKI